MAASSKIMLLNGPNLNMLGVREPDIYGTDTLDDIRAVCLDQGAALGIEVDFRQSNSEGELVGWIQSTRGDHAGIIINPAAYTHTSIAIRDALLAASRPTVEIHLTNTYARESFRHRSLIADIVVARVMGFGARSYELGLKGLIAHLKEDDS